MIKYSSLLILLFPFLLSARSSSGTSGGVGTSSEFPLGSCEGQGVQELSGANTGCGWKYLREGSYYIMPNANLRGADLSGADLSGASLAGADLSGAYLYGTDLRGANLSRVTADSSTICPNGINYGASGNDCGF